KGHARAALRSYIEDKPLRADQGGGRETVRLHVFHPLHVFVGHDGDGGGLDARRAVQRRKDAAPDHDGHASAQGFKQSVVIHAYFPAFVVSASGQTSEDFLRRPRLCLCGRMGAISKASAGDSVSSVRYPLSSSEKVTSPTSHSSS